MMEYTTNQPIGSIVSDKPFFSTGANPPPYQGSKWHSRDSPDECNYCKEEMSYYLKFNMKLPSQKELTPYINKANIVITDNATLTEATDLLSKLNTKLDEIVADREKITKPLNTSLREVRMKYKPFESALEQAILFIRNQMSTYATKIENERKLAEAKIAARVEAGTLKITTAVDKLSALETVAPVTTENGGLTFRPKEVLKIIDENLIPREYLEPDTDMIFTDIKNGKDVAGCVLEIIQVPYNSRT